MTPIEALLAQVDWTAVPSDPSGGPTCDDDLYATHSGVLRIGDLELRCYRLSDGRAVINADDFQKLFGPFLEAGEAIDDAVE